MEKVLVILSSLCNDGVTHVVMNYYRHIDKEKIQFDFLVESCREDIRQEIELYGGKIFVIPNRTSRPIKYMKTLNSICKKGYQIVHIHHNSANLIVMAGLVAKLNNIPNIIGHSRQRGETSGRKDDHTGQEEHSGCQAPGFCLYHQGSRRQEDL